MEWWTILILILVCLIFLFLIGLPVAFSFLLLNMLGFYFFMGGVAGVSQLILSIYQAVTTFAFLPVLFFILMGDLMFRSGIAGKVMDVLDKWLGRIPGRLGLLAVGGGSLFATLSGSAMAGAAMLGSVLIPDMIKRGYHKEMSIGPILGSGGLAIMIPPSALGVGLAALGRFPVGDFLIAIIIPGFIMGILYASYIIIRCMLQPHLAPVYDLTDRVSLLKKISLTFRYVVPLGSIVFLVVGLIFLGVATPSESAAMGALGCFILVFIYNKGFNWKIIKGSIEGTIRVSIMLFMILAGSTAFSQLLAYTGASQGAAEMAVNIPLPPIFILIAMQIILLMLGTFMEPFTIIMVTISIFMPIIEGFGWSPLWFGVIMLLNMEMATTSPPFGLVLFVMKGVAPPGTTMGDIYKAGIPFILCDLVAMILIVAFPQLVLWLPSLMR